MPKPPARLKSFLLRRLSPEGYLGLHFTLGVLIFIAASWLFVDLGREVVSAQALAPLDARVAGWLHSHASASLTRFMLVVSYLHGTAITTAYVVLLGIFFIRRDNWYRLAILLAVVPLGMLLNVLMKHTFQRARPIVDHPLLNLTTYSFPSGHAAGATLLYGVLAAYLFSRLKSWQWRAVVASAATTMVALVGASRIYLGVHYPSDVLGAVLEAIAWLALCLTVAASWRRHRVLPLVSTSLR